MRAEVACLSAAAPAFHVDKSQPLCIPAWVQGSPRLRSKDARRLSL
jgi:hypothetical protein